MFINIKLFFILELLWGVCGVSAGCLLGNFKPLQVLCINLRSYVSLVRTLSHSEHFVNHPRTKMS